MKIKGRNPDTGEERTEEVEDMGKDDLSDLTSTHFRKREISRHIDNLNMPAEVKVLLDKMATVTIKVGKTIVKIGQKILEMVISIVKAYPNTAFGLVLGYILGLLIASIPILGWVFGSIATKLLIALGAWLGAKADFTRKEKDDSNNYPNGSGVVSLGAFFNEALAKAKEDIREVIRKEVSRFDVLKSGEVQGV